MIVLAVVVITALAIVAVSPIGILGHRQRNLADQPDPRTTVMSRSDEPAFGLWTALGVAGSLLGVGPLIFVYPPTIGRAESIGAPGYEVGVVIICIIFLCVGLIGPLVGGLVFWCTGRRVMFANLAAALAPFVLWLLFAMAQNRTVLR